MKFFAYDIGEDLRLELGWLFSGQIADWSNRTIEVHLSTCEEWEYFLNYMEYNDKEVIAVK